MSRLKLKLNTEYVFVSSSGTYKVLTIIKNKNRRFVQMEFSDAFESIGKSYDMSNFPQKYFQWSYDKFKELIEKEWEFLGEL
jgi:hypothetical protein